MGVGDEIGLTEPLYQELIGRYVATIEVLTKRLVAKDQKIAMLETENSKLETQLLDKTQTLHPGEVVYLTDGELEAIKPKRKK